MQYLKTVKPILCMLISGIVICGAMQAYAHGPLSSQSGTSATSSRSSSSSPFSSTSSSSHSPSHSSSDYSSSLHSISDSSAHSTSAGFGVDVLQLGSYVTPHRGNRIGNEGIEIFQEEAGAIRDERLEMLLPEDDFKIDDFDRPPPPVHKKHSKHKNKTKS
jgi:hypothetical protein